MESELEIIKNKLKSDNYDINAIEKKLSKIEKNLNKFRTQFNENDNQNNPDPNSSNDSDDLEDIDIIKIIKDVELADEKLSSILDNKSIEEIMEQYDEFTAKLSLIRGQNENYKLSIEYL